MTFAAARKHPPARTPAAAPILAHVVRAYARAGSSAASVAPLSFAALRQPPRRAFIPTQPARVLVFAAFQRWFDALLRRRALSTAAHKHTALPRRVSLLPSSFRSKQRAAARSWRFRSSPLLPTCRAQRAMHHFWRAPARCQRAHAFIASFFAVYCSLCARVRAARARASTPCARAATRCVQFRYCWRLLMFGCPGFKSEVPSS